MRVTLVGSVQDICENMNIGLVINVDPRRGIFTADNYVGDGAFGSAVTFEAVRVTPDQLEILAQIDHKRLFVFRTTGTQMVTIPLK